MPIDCNDDAARRVAREKGPDAYLEATIVEGFLPYEWQHAIQQQSERVFPTKKYDPHPDMGWEFELDFRQHSSHRAVFLGVSAIFVIGNAYLIAKVWKVLGRPNAS